MDIREDDNAQPAPLTEDEKAVLESQKNDQTVKASRKRRDDLTDDEQVIEL